MGRITALWPGSSIHAQATFKSIRFEDFEYEYLDEERPFSWLGNGLTASQQEGGFTTSYLDTVDIPPPIVEGVDLWTPNDPYGYGVEGSNGVPTGDHPPDKVEKRMASVISSMPT